MRHDELGVDLEVSGCLYGDVDAAGEHIGRDREARRQAGGRGVAWLGQVGVVDLAAEREHIRDLKVDRHTAEGDRAGVEVDLQPADRATEWHPLHEVDVA